MRESPRHARAMCPFSQASTVRLEANKNRLVTRLYLSRDVPRRSPHDEKSCFPSEENRTVSERRFVASYIFLRFTECYIFLSGFVSGKILRERPSVFLRDVFIRMVCRFGHYRKHRVESIFSSNDLSCLIRGGCLSTN